MYEWLQGTFIQSHVPQESGGGQQSRWDIIEQLAFNVAKDKISIWGIDTWTTQ